VWRAQDGKTPLHYAAQEGHAFVLTLLLERGADKEAKQEVRGAPQRMATAD
jgi:ankyrin repeat protein